MEPLDYPENDPGPYTLLAQARPEETTKRLEWLLSRATGYFGVTNYLGGKFLKSEEALNPFVGALKARGLAFLDDGSAARSRQAAASAERARTASSTSSSAPRPSSASCWRWRPPPSSAAPPWAPGFAYPRNAGAGGALGRGAAGAGLPACARIGHNAAVSATGQRDLELYRPNVGIVVFDATGRGVAGPPRRRPRQPQLAVPARAASTPARTGRRRRVAS
jgi:hypothetical protein